MIIEQAATLIAMSERFRIAYRIAYRYVVDHMFSRERAKHGATASNRYQSLACKSVFDKRDYGCKIRCCP